MMMFCLASIMKEKQAKILQFHKEFYGSEDNSHTYAMFLGLFAFKVLPVSTVHTYIYIFFLLRYNYMGAVLQH